MNEYLNFRYIVGVFIFLIYGSSMQAQFALPRTPISEKQELSRDIPTVMLRAYDEEAIIRAQERAIENGGPAVTGKGYSVDIGIDSHGSWVELENGQRVWRLRIHAPSAPGIKLVCDQFMMPEGSSLYIYPPDKRRIYGAYTSLNNKEQNSFATGYLEGDDLILEYNEPAGTQEAPQFRISIVFYNREHFNGTILGDDCHNNVNCVPFAEEFCNEVRGVVKIEIIFNDGIGGFETTACSGSLINNQNQDFDPLILTAAHCVNSEGPLPLVQPENWVIYYNWQSPECATVIGNDLMTTVGVEVIDFIGPGGFPCAAQDVGLIRVTDVLNAPTNIPTAMHWNYNVFYNGWNRNNRDFLPDDDLIGIHHPGGDVKKFSEGTIIDETDFCWVIEPTNGTWEGGSSGSPLFTTNRRITSVLSAGSPDLTCESDVKGSPLSLAWVPGNLNTHLGPVWVFDGIDPLGACQEDIELFGYFYPAADWGPQERITVQAANSIVASPNLLESMITASPVVLGTNLGNTADYVFRAGKSVSLRPGFSAVNGNRFRAEIGECLEFEGCGFNSSFREGQEQAEQTITKVETESGFHLYPNPAKAVLNIEGKDIRRIEVSSLMGQKIQLKVKRTSDELHSLHVDALEPGTYFVRIHTSDAQYVAKWIKL